MIKAIRDAMKYSDALPLAIDLIQEIQKAIQTYQSETGYDIGQYGAETQSQTSRFASDLQKNTETYRTNIFLCTLLASSASCG